MIKKGKNDMSRILTFEDYISESIKATLLPKKLSLNATRKTLYNIFDKNSEIWKDLELKGANSYTGIKDYIKKTYNYEGDKVSDDQICLFISELVLKHLSKDINDIWVKGQKYIKKGEKSSFMSALRSWSLELIVGWFLQKLKHPNEDYEPPKDLVRRAVGLTDYLEGEPDEEEQ